MLQSGSGGLFGGEQLAQSITLERGAAVHVTTQAAAIVHAARGAPATAQDIDLNIGPQAFLEYLPEPVILFPDARLAQRTVATLAPGAVLLFSDGFVRHDPDPADRPFASCSNELEVCTADGRLLFADRMDIVGADFDASLGCGDQRWRAFGVFVIATPRFSAMRTDVDVAINRCIETLNQSDNLAVYCGLATLPNDAGILCRILAQHGAGLRAAFETCWYRARLALSGAPPPRRRK